MCIFEIDVFVVTLNQTLSPQIKMNWELLREFTYDEN